MSVLKGCIELRLCGTQSQWGTSRSVLLTQYCGGDKIEKDEIGGACSAYGEGRGVYGVLVGETW